jgi:hypothetical protein
MAVKKSSIFLNFINEFNNLEDFQKASLEYAQAPDGVFGTAQPTRPSRLH